MCVGGGRRVDRQGRHARLSPQFESVTEAEVAAAAAGGVTLLSFDQVADAGKATPTPPTPPQPGDLAFICYTCVA